MKASHARKLLRPIEATYAEMFSGKVFTVGKGAVSVRNQSGEAINTVIAVHGFLENHCYFTQTYQAPDTELILLSCSNYHVPVSGPVSNPAPWQHSIKHLEGTIEYDASILNQALQHLPTTQRVRVHGHSRGGAVIMEAIRQRPELYEHVDVVLEAPLLPQAKLHSLVYAILDPISHGMWPWVIRLINSTPSSRYTQTFFGRMNERKKLLLDKAFTATKDHLTIVRNLENIIAWSEKVDFDVYKHMRHGTILIPKVDRILDRDSMLSSAQRSPNSVRLVETGATSHFITLDSLEWVPSLNYLPEYKTALA